MWDRWKAGDTLHEISKLFYRPHTSIQNILSDTGCIDHQSRARAMQLICVAMLHQVLREHVLALLACEGGAHTQLRPEGTSYG